MIFNHVISTIIALAITDLYFFIIKLVSNVLTKRINSSREKMSTTENQLLPIEVNQGLINGLKIAIIISVIIGIIASIFMGSYNINTPLLLYIKDKILYGLLFILIVVNIVVIYRKVKYLFHIIKHKDGYANEIKNK